jgi:hypothetical protein
MCPFPRTVFPTVPGHGIVRTRNGQFGEEQVVRQLSHPVRTTIAYRVPAVEIGVFAFPDVSEYCVTRFGAIARYNGNYSAVAGH